MAQKNPLEIRKLLESKPKPGTPEFSDRAFWRRERLFKNPITIPLKKPSKAKSRIRPDFNISSRTKRINTVLKGD